LVQALLEEYSTTTSAWIGAFRTLAPLQYRCRKHKEECPAGKMAEKVCEFIGEEAREFRSIRRHRPFSLVAQEL